MKTRTPLIRAALAMAMIGSAFALERVPSAAGTGMTIETRTPVHATLLPELSVVARTDDPDLVVATNLAATAALPVTLMPTVHVVARRGDIAASTSAPAFDPDATLLAAAD